MNTTLYDRLMAAHTPFLDDCDGFDRIRHFSNGCRFHIENSVSQVTGGHVTPLSLGPKQWTRNEWEVWNHQNALNESFGPHGQG